MDKIAAGLERDGVLTGAGRTRWHASTNNTILRNEKYISDALLQKTYTTAFLTKKTKVNEGEIPQYYVENNHEAIIEPEIFEMAQREILKRGKGKKYHSTVHLFSTKIKCGCCGGWYGSKLWHSNSKYRRSSGNAITNFQTMNIARHHIFTRMTLKPPSSPLQISSSPAKTA